MITSKTKTAKKARTHPLQKDLQKCGDGCRERILDAAQKLFCEKGFVTTSTRTIAAAADCNIAQISYYFGSKEGLLEAVGLNVAEKVSRELDSLQKLDLPPEQQLEHFIDFVTNHVQQNREFVLLLLKSFLAEGRSPPKKIQQQIHKNIVSVVRLFSNLQNNSAVKKDLVPELAATALMSMVMFHNVLGPLLDSIAKQAHPALSTNVNKTIKSIFLNGILNRPPCGGKLK